MIYNKNTFISAYNAWDDGLYEAFSNLKRTEPWNFWRTVLQLYRERLSLEKSIKVLDKEV